MRRALDLARSYERRTSPNPRVGCVLVDRDGAIIAEGLHRGAGAPHAEVDALTKAGAAARGSTAVVTLEPCNHSGRTGPCSEALAAAGIGRVVFGQSDPNPAAGGGAQTLRAAGIAVEAGVLEDEAHALNERWTFALVHGRPFVTWKYAATLDGRSAAVDGTSQWITGPPARADVQRLRADCDAIVVGTGTVRADDPHLTLRDAADRIRPYDDQPLRVVVGQSPVAPRARVLDDAAPSVQIHATRPAEVLAELHRREVRQVWLEGGPRLAGAFLEAGLVDEVVAYIAPKLLGAGAAALTTTTIRSIGEALELEVVDTTLVGDDLRLTARPVEGDH